MNYRVTVSITLFLLLLLNGTAVPFFSSPLAGEGARTVNVAVGAVSPPDGLQSHVTRLVGSSTSLVPGQVSGVLKVLVVPVQFSDFSNTTDIETNIIAEKATPLAAYYDEVSYGRVTLDVQHLSDWVTLFQTREYYGVDSETEVDVNLWSFVQDSLFAADPFVNYRDYGYVLLVHAGDDQAESGDTLDIWSQASLGKEFFTHDGGVSLGFAILAENDPVGVFAHEFGHNIELPDLYDYYQEQYFAREWSLMDYGSWLDPPSSLMAPEKMWLDWIQPANVTVVDTGDIMNVTLARLETPDEVLAVKIPVGYRYYVVEYRRRVLTDSELPMEGVVVSYVDETLSAGHGIVRVMDAEPSSRSLRDAAFVSGTRFVDSDNEVAVKVFSLGSTNASIRVQKGFADLVADQIQFAGDVLQGENVSFDVYVKNVGVTASDPAVVSVSINGVEFQRKELAAVDPGSQTVLELGPWRAESGLNQIEVTLDLTDSVIEKDETNNVISAFLDVPRHYVSIDRASVSGQRVDVNSTQQVYFHAVWGDNGSDIVDGTVYINGSAYATNSTGWLTFDATSSVIRNVSWAVTGVDVRGFFAYKQEVPNPWIVWDFLEAYDYGIPGERCDVNSTQTVWVRVRYAYDATVFDDSAGTLTIGDEPAEWDAQSVYWTISVSESDVGQTNYTLPYSFEDEVFGLKLMVGQRQVRIIWDRVRLTLSYEDQRTSVGSAASVRVDGTYASDSAPWNGTVAFNDTLTKTEVGRFSYAVTSISDPYGLSIFEANTFTATFDRVLLSVSTSDTRIDVGETAQISVTGVHEYDGSAWNGDFTLNDTVTENEVGAHVLAVGSITDPSYNVTAFDGNGLLIIWDRVEIVLSTDQDRVNVGSSTSMSWTGSYEYDGAVFAGNVTLSEDVASNSVGLVHYTARSISDPLYNLTAFTSNTVDVVFDRILCSASADTSTTGTVRLELNLTSEFDGEPVSDANVTVETTRADWVGNGRYVVVLSEWKPYATYRIRVEKGSFAEELSTSLVIAGNLEIMAIAIVIVAAITIGAVVLHRGRRREHHEQKVESPI